MADWMMDTFFIFCRARARRVPGGLEGGPFPGARPAWEQSRSCVEEEDYYTPEWALDEEEWADGDA